MREPSVKETVKLVDRVVNVAKGAALMTETEMKWRLVTISAEVIANTPLCQAMEKNLHMLGAPDFTDVDVAYAKRFQNTLEQKDITASYSMLGLGVQRDKVLADFLPPLGHQSNDLPASTDVGDVSWVVPTVQLWGGQLCHRNALSYMANGCAGEKRPCAKGHGACRNGYGDDRCGRDHQPRAARGRMGGFENTCRRRGICQRIARRRRTPDCRNGGVGVSQFPY